MKLTICSGSITVLTELILELVLVRIIDSLVKGFSYILFCLFCYSDIVFQVYAKFHKHRLELEEAFDMGLLSSMNCDACKFKPHSILGLLGHMTSPSHLKNSYEVFNNELQVNN